MDASRGAGEAVADCTGIVEIVLIMIGFCGSGR